MDDDRAKYQAKAAVDRHQSNVLQELPTVSDLETLLEECRMIAEPTGICPDKPMDPFSHGPPHMLMPEQKVTVCSGGDNAASDSPSTSTSHEEDLSSNRRIAITIAKGRKVKLLKRKASENENASARQLKVRRCDLQTTEVTEEEVESVIKEMSKKTTPLYYEAWTIPLCITTYRNTTRIQWALTFTGEEVSDDLYEVIETPHFPDDLNFRRRLCVFRDLWRRGYYLTDGLKFGCDFLAYENKPSRIHSKYMVRCVDATDSMQPLDMIAVSRVSSQVNKLILIAVVSFDSPFPYYVQCSWWNSKMKFERRRVHSAIRKLFYSFFKSLVGKDVVVELKNDLSICGTLHSVDQYLNMKLTDISVGDSERYPHMLSVKNCFIRGSVVRYVQLPADQIDTQLLQDASRKEVMQAKR
ncbi:unnamed protein product [Anisakis simplex]|uniref:U6 snRNA-associated Sm-like protein LSm2 n=1 Tax=Anisakis simplex TaxID=6269 RepID=A0A0M3K771_ANISI|nr:unnamed protein product [Anisakis simplex]